MSSRAGKNPNGEGTIYQRKDGRFEAATYVTTSEGTRKRKRVYGQTWEAVHKALVGIQAAEHRGIPTPAASLSIGQFLDEWLEHIAQPAVRATTYAKYETFVRLYLKPGLGTRRLTQLSPAEVRRFLAGQREAGISASRLQAIHAVLRNALEHAMREDLVVRNAAKLVRMPTPPRRDFEPWTAQQALDFLAASRTDPLATAFLLCITLGLRRGEVLGLRWTDLDLDDGTLRVRRQLQRSAGELQLVEVKTTRSRRAVPLPEVCVRALKRRRGQQNADRLAAGAAWMESDLVFTTGHGTPVEPRNMARSFARIVAAAGAASAAAARSAAPVLVVPGLSAGPAPHDHGDPRAQPNRGDHERLHPCHLGRAAAGDEAHGRPARRPDGVRRRGLTVAVAVGRCRHRCRHRCRQGAGGPAGTKS